MMMKTCVTTSADNKALTGAIQQTGSVHIHGGSSEAEIISSFLLTSARYLGIDTGYCQQITQNPPGGEI